MKQTQGPEYDLTNPQVLADPYPLFHQMRREDPVHWSDTLQAWVLTSYEQVLKALRDPCLSNQRIETFVKYQLRNSDPALAADFERVANETMFMKDGADHHRLRVLGNRGFTPSVLDRARPMLQKVVDELLDAVQDRGHMDIALDLSQRLPALVIAEMFGIRAEDRHLFQESSEAMAKFFGGTMGNPEVDARAANVAAVEMERYFHALLEARRQSPGEDLMSLFSAGQAEGKLSAAEVCCQCILLLIAGHVTTIDQLSNAIHAFLQHPDQLQRLRDAPSLLRTAVEECLRHDPAVTFLYRIAVADLEIGGKSIRKGQMVYLCTAAANRDPDIFSQPDRFDIARATNSHLTFGTGVHLCLGSGLTRRELEIGLTTLFHRMPNLRLDEEKPPRRKCESLVFRGFHTLPAVF
jgi:cytochrome P450 PksS